MSAVICKIYIPWESNPMCFGETVTLLPQPSYLYLLIGWWFDTH
jgi:hypothetical protein